MTVQGNLWGPLTSNLSVSSLPVLSAALVVTYYFVRVIYNLYFHPLSKHPGPRLAAATDLWWAWASTTGRYPWIINDVLKQYGDIVRIAPNELVFINPRAAKDIYLAQEKNLERFVQVGYDALDTGDGGISGEANPVRHREIAKKLAPAFSMRNLKAKEATIHKHLDLFIKKMKEIGNGKRGVEMQQWSDWLALDLSADMTYGREMGQMRDMKNSVLLHSTLKLNLFVTTSQITRKFRLFSPLTYLTIPPSVWFAMSTIIKMNSQDVKARIERRGKTEHLDYFEQLVPAGKPVPDDKKEIFHLENVAGQLLLASWQPLADQFYSLIFFLLQDLDVYAVLAKEIRTAFADYNNIGTETIGSLEYLHACVQESLRLHQTTVNGLPRVSPGANVDGTYIPQGTICQISYFAAARSSRFFTDPLNFRPERWLKQGHPRFDPKYKEDDLTASKPFSQGLRGCPGGAIALTVIRSYVAKVLWEFDIEVIEGKRGLSFEKDFKFLTFWVRFKPARRRSRE